MLPNALTEHFYHKVRKPIDYRRLIPESVCRIDHAENLNNTFDAIETAECPSDFGQHDEPSLTSRRIALLYREFFSNLPIGLPSWTGGVTGKKQQIANPNSIYVVGNRRCFRRERDVFLFQSRL